MPDTHSMDPLIQTKLHRPPLPADLVPRPRLTDLLDEQTLPPLILISAPAGYGKSTLAKSLVEALDLPAAWLSLDILDNDLGIFLRYFVADVRTIFPEALPETLALLRNTPLPPLSAITKILINELDQMDRSFLLVLDDYHEIEKQEIHDLLNWVLLYPPRSLHLVISTRMDPPLPLVNLRASGKLVEIRTQDLRFNSQETLSLFRNMIGKPIDQAAVDEMEAKAEGWVTGLRLAALAMRHRVGRESIKGELSIQNRYVSEYLVSEILAKQAANLSDCMLKTSILDRFCADLCATLCSVNEEPGAGQASPTGFDGVDFIEWLRSSNLFVIPLDDRYEWFRYHHLFQDFLKEELRNRYNQHEVNRLHIAAGEWYARKGWIEEALGHFLKAGEPDAAILLIAEQRNKMLNTTQWQRLGRWLDLFPAEVIERTPELWMLKTWLIYHQGRFTELPALLDHLDSLIGVETNPLTINYLLGGMSSLRSLVAYHQGDAQQAILYALHSLDLLPTDLWIVRVLARTYLGGAYLLQGENTKSVKAFYDAFEEEVLDKRFKATILMTVCNIHWMSADLVSMEQAAKQCITLSQETGQQQILGFSSYHLARVRYHQDRLGEAEQLFSNVVSRPYLNYGIPYANSACGLALTYQAQGEEAKAQQVAEDAVGFLLETGNTTQLPIALALQAELAIMQGKVSAASQWAEKFDPVPPLAPIPWFLAPHLTLVKVWLAQNTSSSLEQAAELLDQMERYLADTHNKRFLIETLGLNALLLSAEGDQPAAFSMLQESLRLAQPGGFIRLFVDLGHGMGLLLNELEAPPDLQPYLKQIKNSLMRPKPREISSRQAYLVEPLTRRELEVLNLLEERRTDKEIALQLGIAPGTVRQHTHNLYQKLNVSNRRDAVIRALELGLLPR